MRFFPAALTAIFLFIDGSYLSAQTTAQTAENKSAPANEKKGMPPRSAPGDYQAHVQVGTVTIAADFAGHAVPRNPDPLTTEDYVVIETAVFGPSGARLTLSPGDFSLRVNGKKTPLESQPYGFVVRSLKDPDWSPPAPPEKSKSSFGTGGGGDSNSPPPIVHVPIEIQRAMLLHVQKVSLPEGDRALPEAGLLYFQYRGKTQSLHSLELIYSGPAGKGKLDLQP
jgi:hypothetical protein